MRNSWIKLNENLFDKNHIKPMLQRERASQIAPEWTMGEHVTCVFAKCINCL